LKTGSPENKKKIQTNYFFFGAAFFAAGFFAAVFFATVFFAAAAM